MDKSNPLWPFTGPKYGDMQFYITNADCRILMVRGMTDREPLEAALLVPGLQRTVERAIRARLTKLEVK